MKRRNEFRIPRRTNLFFEYFRVTFLLIIVTTFALCAVFIMFMMNYWTSSNVKTIKRNVAYLVQSVEVANRTGNTDTLYVDFHTVSDTVGGDFFLTDNDGNIVICKEILDDNLNHVYENARECKVHRDYCVSSSILEKTTASGYYTMDNVRGLDDTYSIIVGQKVLGDDGTSVGFVYGILPVEENINSYIVDMLKMFLAAEIVSLVFAMVFVYINSYRMTKPLKEMARITKLYAKGDFSQRITVKGNNELTDLAEKLNSMAESLEVLDDSRSAFVANVSHELKTPMTSIGGFIDGMLDGTIKKEEQNFYLKIVSDEVKRLSTLVQTMLTLSKIEAGEEKLKPAKTDLKNLLFNVLLNFEKSIDEAKIEISGFEDMDSVKVIADEKMLYQVIYNIYDNAVKFTNEGGTIYVELLEELDKVTISIANTGEGIKDEELRHIFERFYKADKSRSEHVKGVGLGLNLAKNIVELHGGEISVSSTPGELTTFSFWIPKEN